MILFTQFHFRSNTSRIQQQQQQQQQKQQCYDPIHFSIRTNSTNRRRSSSSTTTRHTHPMLVLSLLLLLLGPVVPHLVVALSVTGSTGTRIRRTTTTTTTSNNNDSEDDDTDDRRLSNSTSILIPKSSSSLSSASSSKNQTPNELMMLQQHHLDHLQQHSSFSSNITYVSATNNISSSLSSTDSRNLQLRIIGGNRAGRDEYPSFVFASCGGTLIAHDLVLTAAHCYASIRMAGRVYVGDNRIGRGKAIRVNKVHRHPNYNEETFKNDIAIIKLRCSSKAPVQILNTDPTLPPADGADVTVIGYGTTRSGGSLSQNLQKVTVQTVSNSKCSKSYKLDYTIYNKRMLCAGDILHGNKDSCQGDSGGPLYYGPNNVQVGIVSFGIGCGLKEFPGVYTRVSTYTPWINKMIQKLSSKTPNYC